MSVVGMCTVRGCDGRVDARTDGLGRVILVCSGCERFRRGVCAECAKPRARRSRRCLACGARRKLERERAADRARAVAHYHQRIASLRKHGKLRQFREARRAAVRRWREANPHDDAGRAYLRWYMRKRRQDPVYRDRQNARKRELRALRKSGIMSGETPVMERAA